MFPWRIYINALFIYCVQTIFHSDYRSNSSSAGHRVGQHSRAGMIHSCGMMHNVRWLHSVWSIACEEMSYITVHLMAMMIRWGRWQLSQCSQCIQHTQCIPRFKSCNQLNFPYYLTWNVTWDSELKQKLFLKLITLSSEHKCFYAKFLMRHCACNFFLNADHITIITTMHTTK